MASFTFTKCDPLGTFTIFTLPSPRLLKFNVNICIEAYFFFQTELVFDAGRWVGQGEQHQCVKMALTLSIKSNFSQQKSRFSRTDQSSCTLLVLLHGITCFHSISSTGHDTLSTSHVLSVPSEVSFLKYMHLRCPPCFCLSIEWVDSYRRQVVGYGLRFRVSDG